MSAKIAAALHQVMSQCGYVQKTGKNSFHNYRYASEADLLEKLRPAMLEAGLLLIPSVTSVTPVDEHGNTTVQLEYTLAHKDGDIWPDKIGAAGTGNDRNKNGVGDKGTYKALTGANKYLLFKLFQIETGDDPETTEAEHPAPAKPRAVEPAPPAPPVGATVSKAVRARLLSAMDGQMTRTLLASWASNQKVRDAVTGLTDEDQVFFEAAYRKKWESLPESQAMAG